MKFKLFSILFLITMTLSTLWAGMMPPKDEMAALDKQIDKLMLAFNDKDTKVFYSDWSKSMAALCTPAMFKMMFVDMHMKKYGKYVSREIIEAETVVMANQPNALLVYKAEFEKNKKVKLAINLIKEDGKWKIQQVSLVDIP